MDERSLRKNRVGTVLRYEFRTSFEIAFCNKWGHFIDHGLSNVVYSFTDWVDYPKGDRTLDTLKHPITCAVISTDGYTMFTGTSDKNILVWDLQNYTVIDTLKHCCRYAVISLDYHHSGLLGYGGSKGSVSIWNVFEREKMMDWDRRSGLDTKVIKFNQSGDLMASATISGLIRIWSVNDGDCVSILDGHSDEVRSVFFLGSSLLSGSCDSTVREWDYGTESQIRKVQWSEGIYQVSINSDQSKVACIFGGGFKVYEWPTMEEIGFEVRMDCFRGCFHSINPDLLAVTDYDFQVIGMYSVSKGELIRTINADLDTIIELHFTPDGFRMLAVFEDHSLQIWDVSDLI